MAFMSLMVANGLILIVLLAVLLALVLFIAASVVSIVFAAGKKKRAAQGKRLGGKIAIPITLFVLSALIAIPLCIGGAVMMADSNNRNVIQAADSDVFHAESANALASALDSHTDLGVDDYQNQSGDGYGETLLQNAIRLNDADKVDLLLSRGADPDKGKVPPMACALKADADTPGADSYFGESDLKAGRDAYNPRIVLALLDAGASPNYDAEDSQYLTWLIKDMFGNGIDETDVDVVRSMVSHGAKTTAKDMNGKSPFEVFLELAQRYPAKDSGQAQSYDAIQLLLQ